MANICGNLPILAKIYEKLIKYWRIFVEICETKLNQLNLGEYLRKFAETNQIDSILVNICGYLRIFAKFCEKLLIYYILPNICGNLRIFTIICEKL